MPLVIEKLPQQVPDGCGGHCCGRGGSAMVGLVVLWVGSKSHTAIQPTFCNKRQKVYINRLFILHMKILSTLLFLRCGCDCVTITNTPILLTAKITYKSMHLCASLKAMIEGALHSLHKRTETHIVFKKLGV